MSENKKPEENDAKAKMREALERKQAGKGHGVTPGSSAGSKVSGAAGGSGKKMFRRKSGSA